MSCNGRKKKRKVVKLHQTDLQISDDFGRITSGLGSSKLTALLVNFSLKSKWLIFEIHQYFLLKKCEKLLHCKSFSHVFNRKYLYLVIKL